MNIIAYETYQETKDRGNPLFPFNIYPCCIPGDFSSVPLHWHNEMEFIYIKKGFGTVSVNLTTYDVKAGDIIFIFPGQLHSILQKKPHAMDYENIIFDMEFLFSPGTDLCTTQFLRPITSGYFSVSAIFSSGDKLYPFMASCLNELDHINQEQPTGYVLGIKSILFRIFFLLFSHNEIISSISETHKSMEHVKTTIKYIENHYAERISISEIADVLHLSSSHFMRFFKATMGVSFIHYLNDYRLTMASRQLTASNDSILSIASQCGFENLSLFNRLFKKEYNMTPREYRKQHQK